jgi:branched-chain amino acid transport system permease protein
MRKIILVLALFLLLAAPWLCDRYSLSVLVLTLYMACLGQSWNLLLGYSGQLSLGHALYSGLGGYLAVAFFLHLGVSPFLAAPMCFLICGILGASIVALSFRFGIKNVQFTLLTITFAYCCQIIFEHVLFFGANGGLFIPLSHTQNFWLLRMDITYFYYLFLCLCALIFSSIWFFMHHTRLGYFTQALRDNEMSAEALGIATYKIKISMMALSAGLTSICGIFYAFYQNNLFPDQSFSSLRSVELMMGPIFGGIGTLFGPVFGSFLLVPLGEMLNHFLGESITGIKHLFYGVTILLGMMRFPKGLWPVMQKKWAALP